MLSTMKIKKVKFSEKKFINQYVKHNEPVILIDAVKHWDALNKWNISYLEKIIPNNIVEYRESRSIYHPDFYSLKNNKILKSSFIDFKKEMAFKNIYKKSYFLSGEFFNLLKANKINENLKVLWSDFSVPNFINVKQLEHIGFWISTKKIISWLHYDGNGAHNFNVQISGKKKITLISPHQANNCYLQSYNNPDYFNFSKVDVNKPNYSKFSKFKNVICYKEILNPGEVLYIPPFWLHSFEHLNKFNINLNFWWHDVNVNLNPLALRGHFLYQLRNVLGNKKKILTRKELLNELKKMPLTKKLIDKIDSSFI